VLQQKMHKAAKCVRVTALKHSMIKTQKHPKILYIHRKVHIDSQCSRIRKTFTVHATC